MATLASTRDAVAVELLAVTYGSHDRPGFAVSNMPTPARVDTNSPEVVRIVFLIDLRCIEIHWRHGLAELVPLERCYSILSRSLG